MWQKIKNVYHLFVAILANILFLFPSKKIKVIAVTGTDGKTTTVNLIYHILKNSGKKVSVISSINAVVGGRIYETGSHVTTPDSFFLQKMFWKAKKAGSEFFVLEVTSHSIDQNRIFGIPIKVGVLTNVTNEHLDYHKTYDNYLRTKMKILRRAEYCVVNSDDMSYTLLAEVKELKPKEKWITYGLSESSDYNPKTFDIRNSNLMGDFNKYNVLAAVAVSRVAGIDDDKIKEALRTFVLPLGREDFVYKKEFSVMIDFAHTPNSFEQILKSVRPLTKGKIIHVFGSAGERDRMKRPFLGEISSEYSDILILTAEDPRKEDVNDIISQIENGVKKGKCDVIKIPDRKEAIDAAIQMANKGDMVLITGKAQESTINYGNGEEQWDEFQVVDKAIKAKEKFG